MKKHNQPHSSNSSPPSSLPPSPLDARNPSSLTVPYASSSSSSSAVAATSLPSPNPTASTSTYGFRSQLGNLIPRHALFQVHLHIDQLSNVPLVKGQFGVRWKFKNVQSSSSLLSKMKGSASGNGGGGSSMVSGGLKLARSSSLNLKQIHSRRSKKKSKDDDSRGRSTSRTNAKAKGKARATEIGLGIGVGPHIQVTLHDDQNDDVEHQVPMMGDTSHNHTEDDEDDDDEPLRSSYESQDLPTTTTSIDHHSDDSATNIYGQYLASSPPQSPYLSETPLPPSSVDTPQTALPLGSATPTLTKATFAQMAEQQLQFGSFSHSDSRGMTEWAKLHSYNVKWEQKVSVAVQMDVHRETNDLLPNELKLVVMQRVVQGDPDAPHQPRVGAVYLNLAEYAGAGPVTRRYLLRESKTNATLKLTIELEHIGGTKNFIPPPLKKGEILAEVSGLLSNNDLLRTRLARNLDLYTRSGSVTPMGSSSFSSTSSSDPTPALSSTPSPLHLNPSTQSNPPPHPYLNPNFSLPKPTTTTSSSSSHILHTHTSIPYATGDGKIDFDLLANVSGLHTTEDLIERLFNPVMTGKKDVESPFVVYDPQEAGGYHTGESGSGRGRGGGRHIEGGRGGGRGRYLGGGERSTSTSTMSSSLSLSSVERSSMADADDRDRESVSDESLFTRGSGSGSGGGGSSRHGHGHGSLESGGGSLGSSSGKSGLQVQTGGEKQHWWQKMRPSRPGTPVSASGTKGFKLPLVAGALEG